MTKHLDRLEANYAVERCEKRIRRSVEIHGGRLVNDNGRRLMAYFADGVDALQSAVEMQRRVSDLPPRAGLPLALRVGICTGHQAKEEFYFPDKGTNPAASLSSIAAPGHILFSVPKRAKFFPWSQLLSNSVPAVALSCGSRQLGVFQLPWQQHDPMALRFALAELGNAAGRLCLRYQGSEMLLDESQPLTRLGRQAGNELTMRDRRCSREHGSIERRIDRFVFVDRSTNGTFVTFEGQPEIFVHHRELNLFGRGRLSLGAPSSEKGVELVQFQTGSFSR
ncbi:MAG: FHA domain-containing protein [Azonexus sp.]|nr:FHA domain-containing protein [Azonexus sp.]